MDPKKVSEALLVFEDMLKEVRKCEKRKKEKERKKERKKKKKKKKKKKEKEKKRKKKKEGECITDIILNNILIIY